MPKSIVITNSHLFGPGPIPLDLKPLNLVIGASGCRFVPAMGAPPLQLGSASRAAAPEPLP